MAAVQNKAGRFVTPSLESGQAALAGVPMPANFRLFVSDPPGAEAYPIVTYTWLLVLKRYDNPRVAGTIKASTEAVKSLALSRDGQRLATSGENGTVRLVQARGGGLAEITLENASARTSWLAFSPDGTRLAAAGASERVTVWDTATGRNVQTFLTDSEPITSIAFGALGN